MANELADALSGLHVSPNDNLGFVGQDNGFVNAIKFEAKPGALAYRNHIRIVCVAYLEPEKYLTERKSKRDAEDLPISAHELRVNHAILADAFEYSNGFGVPGIQYVYDNCSLMYTPVPIPNYTIVIPKDRLRRSLDYISGYRVQIEIRTLGFLDLNDSKFFAVSVATGKEDHELRTFYELLVVQGSLDSRECVAVGSEMYVSRNPHQLEMFANGICFLDGFKKNARIVEEHGKPVMKLVVDPVDSAFYANQRLADSFHDVTGGDYGNPRAIDLFIALYKKVRVYLSFKKSKIFTVFGLSREKLENISFDKDGTRIGVMDHFSREYGFQSLAGQMPALEVKFASGAYGYYPLDCLVVLECQKVPMFKYALVSSTFHDVILKRNSVRAPQRFAKTTICFSYIEKSQEVFQSFGVGFSPCQMIRLGIRRKPQIVTATGTVNPDEKSWFSLRGHQYVDPSSCKKWMVLNASKQNIQDAIGILLNSARNHGLALSIPEISFFNSADLSKENWAQLFNDLVEYGYDFVLLVDSKKSRQANAHNMLKCCELMFGLQTQHVHLETLMKFNCHENIVHKMNIKLHGINYHVVLEPCTIRKLFEDDKIFIVGYDVAHPPSSGNYGNAEPSVVGVSYNACRQYQSFNGNYFFQPGNQESVDPQLMKTAIMHGLEMRRLQRPNTCSQVPELVFIFRDGLSEGQILMAKLEELDAIKDAFIEYYGPEFRLPSFVMVLATKRHNRRFYSSARENVVPGTVAAEGIARLGAKEFYMQTAYPIQGTAKLTDYEVISNEARLSFKDIQAFTHGMCYAHQIVASAVSLPEPVFVAHELAKRGRNNLVCYSDVSPVPRNEDGIDYQKLNKKLTYIENDLGQRRFNA